MARVAVGGVLLAVLAAILPGYGALRDAGEVAAALAAVFITTSVFYYGFRILRWIARRLLWRVRRRLMITYLFVGVTPILLLGLFGVLSAFTGSSQAMARIAAVQIMMVEKAAGASARDIAGELAGLTGDTATTQAWVEQRIAQMQGSLPGSRLAAWITTSGGDSSHSSSPQFVAPTRAVSPVLREALPGWLRGRSEWSGLTYIPDTTEIPSVRVVVRADTGGRSAVVHLEVPLGEAWIERVRQVSDIRLYPWRGEVEANEQGITIRGEADPSIARSPEMHEKQTRDSGESGIRYPVILNATEWINGATHPKSHFVFGWTWADATRQILGSGEFGRVLRIGFNAIGISFVVLEIVALLAAIWMTRAVTGTVHELHQATELIRRGEFSHRARVKSHDQLGELATAFNHMSANIELLLEERVEREKLEREVEIAAEVQAQLFPREVPHIQTGEVAAECRAARGVAGDYYDYVLISPGLMVFGLGDVSGKGISASLVMSNLQASFRAQTTLLSNGASAFASLSAAGGTDPGFSLAGRRVSDARDGAVARMAASINEQLCGSTDANRFATLFLALYDDQTGVLRYTNAGHNSAILVQPDGSTEQLSRGGTILGAFDFAEYEEARATVTPGAVLVVFSDGISEVWSPDGLEYGEERLSSFIVNHRDLSAEALRSAIFQEIDAWSGGRERNDDQTIVILKSCVRPTPPVGGPPQEELLQESPG